jgi:hypothetical protein
MSMSFQNEVAKGNQVHRMIEELIDPAISKYKDNPEAFGILTEIGRKLVFSLEVVPGWARAWLENHPEPSESSSAAATIDGKEVAIIESSSAEFEEWPEPKKRVLGPSIEDDELKFVP